MRFSLCNESCYWTQWHYNLYAFYFSQKSSVRLSYLSIFDLKYLTCATTQEPESATSSPFLFVFGFAAGFCQSCLLYATLSSVEKRCKQTLSGSSTIFRTNITKGWSPTLALFCLIETFGADLGMAIASTIIRVLSKSNVRSSLGNSETTEKVRYSNPHT